MGKETQVKVFFGAGQPFKRVRLHGLMLARGHAGKVLVERDIPPSRFQRVRADVEIGHGGCATARGIHREAAGKTERIQHAPTPRQGFDQPPVLALIKKKPGLLPAHHIGLEANPVFLKNNWSAKRRLGEF